MNLIRVLFFISLAALVICQNSTTFSFAKFDDAALSQFVLNGDAAYINTNSSFNQTERNQRLGLVRGSTFLVGSAFLNKSIVLSNNASFSTAFGFQIENSGGSGDSDGSGADGIVFSLNSKTNVVGGNGGGMGYFGLNNSVGIEFDTYDNGLPLDINGNHVGIDIDGSLASNVSAAYPVRMNDGKVHYAWVDYDGSTRSLEVRISENITRPSAPFISMMINLLNIFGTDRIFVGFSSATGGGYGSHYITSWTFTSTYKPIAIQTPQTTGASTPATSRAMTSAPLTSRSATSSPMTTGAATTRAATSAPLTTRAATSASLTTRAATSSPVTTRAATSAPLTTRAATSAPLTTRAATSAPLTTKSATSSPLTTRAATSAPLTTRAVTSSPITTRAATSAPLTTRSATSAPLTTRAVTSSPLTTRAATSASVPVQPVTSASMPRCGDGIVQSSEQCDGGACCSSRCTFLPSTTMCAFTNTTCYAPSYCTGSDSRCPIRTVSGNFEYESRGYALPIDNHMLSFLDFNLISFGIIRTTSNGAIEGRAIAREDAAFANGYSIATGLSGYAAPLTPARAYSLVVGASMEFLTGTVAPYRASDDMENIFVGGEFSGENSIGSRIRGQCARGTTDCLGMYFDQARIAYSALQTNISCASDNVIKRVQGSSLTLSCSSRVATSYYVSMMASEIAQFESIAVETDCNQQARWWVNVRGFDSFTLGSTNSGSSFNIQLRGVDTAAVVWNVIGPKRAITLNNCNLMGNLLAPFHDLYQNGGTIRGRTIVGAAPLCTRIEYPGCFFCQSS